MVINGSPDLSQLLVNVTWDISGKFPLIRLENLSQGQNLSLVDYAFYVTSPSQTVIHDGNILQPDRSGVWQYFTLYSATPDNTLSPPPTNYIVAPWPRPFGQIEFSGSPYSLTVIAKDSNGNTWELSITQDICRPAGNLPNSNNTYGLGEVDITPDCNRGNLFFENFTNSSYKGLAGTQESSQLKVLYPDDETDTAPTPFIINNFATALVPITYDSQNYEYVYNGVYLYSFGNGSYVRIRYYRKRTFPVNCNIDLCPLVCEYTKLIEKAVTGNCENVAETNKLLLQINGKVNIALMAKSQPLCGIDLPALIEEIKVLGGWDCNCCTTNGIQPFNSANLGDYNFQVISGGGDINGTVEVTGNNIQFILYDKNYIFKICDDAPTSAFTVIPTTAGFTKTYCLNVNMVTLATDLLNTVASNQNLVNLFNSIVQVGSENFKLIVDGDCIFQSTSSCDYVYGLANIPATTTYALLTSLKVGNNVLSVNFAFNLTNLFPLQTYLNSLGYGTFVVTDLGGGNISITSSTNTFGLGDITYKIASVNYIADYSKECTGFLPISANEVVQAIIYYLCDFNDSQLVTSQDYTVCYATGNLGGSPPTLVNQVTVPSGTALNVFLSTLLDRNCDTVTYFSQLGSVFQNGITKTANAVEFGGINPLLRNTQLNQDSYILTFRGDSFNTVAFSKSDTTFIHRLGLATNDKVNVLFHRDNLFVSQISTNGDRAGIAYYAKSEIVSSDDSTIGSRASLAVNYPTTNDTSLASPPALVLGETGFIRVTRSATTGDSLAEIYAKEHTFVGDHSTFFSFPVLPPYTAVEIAAINVSLLRAGMLLFNSSTGKINFWNGAAWEAVTSL